jgi:hypothetical protein
MVLRQDCTCAATGANLRHYNVAGTYGAAPFLFKLSFLNIQVTFGKEPPFRYVTARNNRNAYLSVMNRLEIRAERSINDPISSIPRSY